MRPPGSARDTIMILRHNRETGEAGLLSLPRDLWVEIAGTGENHRINSAFGHGTDVLVQTITDNFGIPINHYLEVDFNGFKTLVDAIGGVEACFEYPTRDKNTGLMVTAPGCYNLPGIEGLQYTRSVTTRSSVTASGGRTRPATSVGSIGSRSSSSPRSTRRSGRSAPTRS